MRENCCFCENAQSVPWHQMRGDLEVAAAELFQGLWRERGRGFASAKEAWAELKSSIEVLKKQVKALEKVHEEMWDADQRKNSDAFAALNHQFEVDAARAAESFMEGRVLAKMAAEMARE